MVKEAVEIATSKPCALKIMKKSVVQDNNLVREVEIMKQLTHPNIITLQDIYETDSELILVLELYVYLTYTFLLRDNLTQSHIFYYPPRFTPTIQLLTLSLRVTGGELFEKIVERVSYTEEDAARLVKQVVSVLEYLHHKDIVHCDLKV